MDSLTIRETFRRFFEDRGHFAFPSASLVPNDPTMLLNSAGMVPFKPFFLGESVPPMRRATSCQKCLRTVDIENVGRTARHLTFFEMLGNFSFGDYFKPEAIRWAWELSVEHFGLDPQRIWVTVYEQDDESPGIWTAETDVRPDQIQTMGWDDNYWWMNVAGPGGPNTELYYDRGEALGVEGGPEVNDERYMEYYNLVFMQDVLDASGVIVGELPSKSVDTGMGLERIAVLLQDVASVYESDLLGPTLERAQQLTGVAYGGDPTSDLSLRVLAEHSRASAFLLADGVLPGKEGRGYVLRRLLRRAVRHARTLGATDQVLPELTQTVVDAMGPAYPELVDQRELIQRFVAAEEAEFGRTLRQGLGQLEDAIAAARGDAASTITGDVAFRLHDTFGFPLDLTLEIVADAGLTIDTEEFQRLMDEQRRRARAGRRSADGLPGEAYRRAAANVVSEFVGYDTTELEDAVAALLIGADVAEDAAEGDDVEVILGRTPFYPEGGGQVGDHGWLETPTGRIEVHDTQTPVDGVIVHRGTVVAGEVASGQPVRALVDLQRRAATARSHSATHILHASVREALGPQAAQAGSLVEPGRLRFDFPHFEQVPRDQLALIEATVNRRVLADPAVTAAQMSIDEARAAGAMALFGEKYGDVVRVVTIGDFSSELCGGTHVGSGARIGGVVVVREESIGANLRRIHALTGEDAFQLGVRERVIVDELARLVDAPRDTLVARVGSLVERLREAERELARGRAAQQQRAAAQMAATAEALGDALVLTQRVDATPADELRQLALDIRSRLGGRGVVVLGSASNDGKALLVATVGADLVAAGVEARSILQPAARAVGGGAGGRGDLAQAGGRDPAALDAALAIARDEVRTAVGA